MSRHVTDAGLPGVATVAAAMRVLPRITSTAASLFNAIVPENPFKW
jgi:hypothetical protein